MSTKGQYRAGILSFYDSATWETTGPLAPLVFKEDFLTPSLVIPATGSLESGVPWCKKIVGAAPPLVAGVANGTNGQVKNSLTAAVEKQNADLYFGDQLTLSIAQGLVVEFRAQVTTVPTLGGEIVWGVASAWADGPDTITYSAFFTADGSAEVFCESDDNATDASATSGVTVLNTEWHIYRIDFSDLTQIRFYIDGVQVAASTSFPWAASAANSKVQPYISCYKAGADAGLGEISVDYVRCWQNRS